MNIKESISRQHALEKSELSYVAIDINTAEVIYCAINVILVALKNDLDVLKMFATVSHFCPSLTAVLFSYKVLQENQIPGDELLVKALTKVLTASQRYMREQTVKESLFVLFVDVGFHECTVHFFISLTCFFIVTVLLVNAHLCVQLYSLNLYLKQISLKLLINLGIPIRY